MAVRFRRSARLDPSQVSDRRGMRAGVPVLAGGGLIGLVVLLLNLVAGGGGSGTSIDLGSDSDLAAECRTGADANQQDDCRAVGIVNSVQSYWGDQLTGYRQAPTVFFDSAVQTGCGNATSAVGPFYCPLDETVYIDLGFFSDLRTRFDATGGPFAEAYVIAHEYGHHVENLTGVLDSAQRGDAGAGSDTVRVELMADCLAGMWARGAVDTGYIEQISEADIRVGLDAAAAVGDDRIQERVQGRVDPEAWTHGSSAQRQQSFLTGYRAGRFEDCDTFTP